MTVSTSFGCISDTMVANVFADQCGGIAGTAINSMTANQSASLAMATTPNPDFFKRGAA